MKVASEKRHKKVTAYFAALLLFTVVFAGCSRDLDEPESALGKNDCITFSLTIPFSVDTRVDKQGHEEVDSDFPTFEDFIKPNDIGIFVFLGEEENAPLVGKWVLLSESKDLNTGMTGYGSHYVITLQMNRSDLNKAKPDIHIGPNSPDTVKFRVVTLANEKINKTIENDYSAYDKCQTYKAFIDVAYVKVLSLGTSFYPSSGSLTSTIPMFGTCLFEVKADDLYYTRPDEVIDLGTVYMLRCLAKVRFIDNTVKNGQYPRISCNKEVTTGSDAGLCYVYRNAYNLPLDAIRYQNGVQMDDIHLCTTYQKIGYVSNIKNTDNNISGILYSSYCPEQKVELRNEVQYPLFTFYYKKTQDSYWETRTVPLKGTRLPDGSYGLIRNHIYTIEVTNEPATRSGASDDLQVKVTDRTW